VNRPSVPTRALLRAQRPTARTRYGPSLRSSAPFVLRPSRGEGRTHHAHSDQQEGQHLRARGAVGNGTGCWRGWEFRERKAGQPRVAGWIGTPTATHGLSMPPGLAKGSDKHTYIQTYIQTDMLGFRSFLKQTGSTRHRLRHCDVRHTCPTKGQQIPAWPRGRRRTPAPPASSFPLPHVRYRCWPFSCMPSFSSSSSFFLAYPYPPASRSLPALT
jgi:hypothetical protein